MLQVPETISGQFAARLLYLSLQWSLDSKAAQQKSAEETQETDREEKRETQPFRHVLAGLADIASHLEAKDPLHACGISVEISSNISLVGSFYQPLLCRTCEIKSFFSYNRMLDSFKIWKSRPRFSLYKSNAFTFVRF